MITHGQSWYLNTETTEIGYRKEPVGYFNPGEVTLIGGTTYYVDMSRTRQYRGVTGSSVQSPQYWYADVASLLSPLSNTYIHTDTHTLSGTEAIFPEWWYNFSETSQDGEYNSSYISRFGFDYTNILLKTIVRQVPSD